VGAEFTSRQCRDPPRPHLLFLDTGKRGELRSRPDNGVAPESAGWVGAEFSPPPITLAAPRRRALNAAPAHGGDALRSLFFIAFAMAPAMASAADIACPTSLTTLGGGAAPPGWTLVPRPSPTGFPFAGPERPGRHALSGISVLDGPPEDVMSEAPATLVPDEGASDRPAPPRLTQRWNLSAGSERGFLLVCHYSGTAAVLTRALPRNVRECRQTLPVDARGRITDTGERSTRCR